MLLNNLKESMDWPTETDVCTSRLTDFFQEASALNRYKLNRTFCSQTTNWVWRMAMRASRTI